MMISKTRQTIQSTKYWLEMLIPSLTMIVFLAFAFFIGLMIVLSIIPVYLGNTSVAKTRFIQTTVRISNYTLSMSQSIGKRDLSQLLSVINPRAFVTLNQGQTTMNSSIQYALQQQLQLGDNQDKFYINILQITPYTTNPTNMSVTLDLMIVYTKECMSCDQHRQLIIFKQLCSNNRLANSVQFLIEYANLSYALSDPVIIYSSYIPIQNIVVLTQIIFHSQSNNLTNTNTNTNTNTTTQMSYRFLANNYTLTTITSKTNYIAILNDANTQNSANQNDGPIPLVGAVTMYPELTQIIEQQIQSSNVFNISINHITLQFWYSNSTVQILMDFLIIFPTSCDFQCTNQRSIQLSNQLANLTNVQVYMQPANLTDGQVKLFKNGSYVLYNYSLTTQVIANFTGTISSAISPILTAI